MELVHTEPSLSKMAMCINMMCINRSQEIQSSDCQWWCWLWVPPLTIQKMLFRDQTLRSSCMWLIGNNKLHQKKSTSNYFLATRTDIFQGKFLMTGQGVSGTNSTPAGRAESEVTATVRHPKILICLFSGDQNTLLATKCFQTFSFVPVTHTNPIKFYNVCIKFMTSWGQTKQFSMHWCTVTSLLNWSPTLYSFIQSAHQLMYIHKTFSH